MRIKKIFMLTSILCFIMCLSFILMISNSYAKYVKSLNMGTSSARVSNFEFVIGDLGSGVVTYDLNLESINPNITELNGIQKVYTLNISNGTVGNVSETALLYYFTLSKTDNLPINISLKDSEGNLLIALSPVVLSGVSETRFEMNSSSLISHTYSLIISWDNSVEYRSSYYAGLFDIIQISANYEQIN